MNDDGISLVRRGIEAVNAGAMTQVAPEILAPDFVRHDLAQAFPEFTGAGDVADLARRRGHPAARRASWSRPRSSGRSGAQARAAVREPPPRCRGASFRTITLEIETLSPELAAERRGHWSSSESTRLQRRPPRTPAATCAAPVSAALSVL
jgi:hypothetical protein